MFTASGSAVFLEDRLSRRPFQRYTPAEKRRAIAKYRRALGKGKTATAAARAAGTDLATVEKWIEQEEAQRAAVAMTTAQRKCLGGCDQRFESSWPGERICPSCKGRFAALSKQWVA